MAGERTDRRTTAPGAAKATAGGRHPRTYQYRGTPKPDPAAVEAEELRTLLAQQRRMISLRSSRLRSLSTELNERVAQALCDGVKVTAIAQATRLPLTSIRSTAAPGDDLFPSGQSTEEHLRSMAAVAEELAEAETARTTIEQKRTQVLATARKLRLLDDYQLASASGLKHDEIRKMTRGVGSRPGPG